MINKFSQNKPKVLIGNNQLVIVVNPFDNFYKFTLSKIVNDEIVRYNLNDFTDLKMTVKGPKNDLDFPVFRESTENDFENGVIIFKISESKNSELAKLSKKNYNLFYINGVDVFGNRQILYSGFYNMWDSKKNIEKLESDFRQENASASAIASQNSANSQEQDSVNTNLNNNSNVSTSTNNSGVPVSEQLINNNIDISSFKPRYRASNLAIAVGIAPSSDDKVDYRALSTKNKADLETNFKNNNYWATSATSSVSYTLAELTKIYPGPNTSVSFDKNLFIEYVEAYFKGLNILPNNTVFDNWNKTTVLKEDLIKYIKTKPFRTNQIITGEYLPLTQEHRQYFRNTNIPRFVNSRPPENKPFAQNISAAPNSVSTSQQLLSTQPSLSSNAVTYTGVQSIVGVVNSSGTTQGTSPISGAEVTITSTKGLFTQIVRTTGADGKFNFGLISQLNVSTDSSPEIKIQVSKINFTATERLLSKRELNLELSSNSIGLKLEMSSLIVIKNVSGQIGKANSFGDWYPETGVQIQAKSLDGAFASAIVTSSEGQYSIEIPDVEFQIEYKKNSYKTQIKYFSTQAAIDLSTIPVVYIEFLPS